eukprot:Cvel_31605.t1-p1 / transcript=Cvel_31605.t1 / gene=Cvel_31605 / organism=Chromera_velia_CCMP2878 / gene_product=hypothetical protein / transcript_product=hypothetical protein / location=Cvel_scaffold4743:1-559(-) / protein_length=186 / sequence_SO=supercontig / SO=protein_coding / is_pseudo=false
MNEQSHAKFLFEMDVKLVRQAPPDFSEAQLAERSRFLLDSCFPVIAETAEESVSDCRPDLDGNFLLKQNLIGTRERYEKVKKNTFHQKVFRLNPAACIEHLWEEGGSSAVKWDEIFGIFKEFGIKQEKPLGEVFFKGRMVAVLRHDVSPQKRKGEGGKAETGPNESDSPPDKSGAGGGSKREGGGG